MGAPQSFLWCEVGVASRDRPGGRRGCGASGETEAATTGPQRNRMGLVSAKLTGCQQARRKHSLEKPLGGLGPPSELCDVVDNAWVQGQHSIDTCQL